LQKAYDSVDREILFRILRRRSKNSNESSLISLIEKLHRDSVIEVGSSSLNAEMGLPQGSILSPVLFNIYLEEALNSSEKLRQVRKRGDLLAFADDMLVMTSDRRRTGTYRQRAILTIRKVQPPSQQKEVRNPDDGKSRRDRRHPLHIDGQVPRHKGLS